MMASNELLHNIRCTWNGEVNPMNELIDALRICSSQPCCDNCPRYDKDHAQETNDCCVNLLTDAADAIERLMDEVDRKDKAIQGLLTQIERLQHEQQH